PCATASLTTPPSPSVTLSLHAALPISSPSAAYPVPISVLLHPTLLPELPKGAVNLGPRESCGRDQLLLGTATIASFLERGLDKGCPNRGKGIVQALRQTI